MFITQGDWIVVMRHCCDSKTKGKIIKAGLTESQAKARATVGAKTPDWNCWAMKREDY